MTVYVKDTSEAAWTTPGTFLWHRAATIHGGVRAVGLKDVSWAKAACGHKVFEPTEFINHEMTFADWDREYGDDVDLCQCAVSAQKDVEQVTNFMRESTGGGGE